MSLAEIDRLTYIDIDGDDNGHLAMDPSVTQVKSNLKDYLQKLYLDMVIRVFIYRPSV